MNKNINGCWNCAYSSGNGRSCGGKNCNSCEQYKAFKVDFIKENFPDILNSQYVFLNKMLEDKEYYGAIYQIKDILEILIKMPVLGILIILNQSIQVESEILDNKKIRAFYQRILGKALALGDWEQLAQEISNISKSDDEKLIKKYCNINIQKDIDADILNKYAEKVESTIFSMSKNITHKNSDILKQLIIKTKLLYEIYQRYPSHNGFMRVSTWRNQNLGHGATKTNLQDVADALRELLKFLNFTLDRTQYLEFDFNEEFIDQNTMKFIAKYHNDVLDLAPYVYHILNEEEAALLFESFNSNNNKAHLLDYCDSTFHYNSDLSTKLASVWNICKVKNIKPLSNNSIDADYVSEEDNKALEALDTAEGKISNKVFHTVFNEFISDNNKGVLLVTAERGMGKTIFAKDISTTTYSYYSITEHNEDNNLIWSYLINDSYSCTYDMFATQLISVVTNTLKAVRFLNEDYINAKTTFENSFSSDSDLNEKKRNFGSFLIHSLKILKEKCQIKKFILVIDGLDEINYAQKNHLNDELFFDNDLPEDLYIVCLARNHSEVKNFNRNTYAGQYLFLEISRNDEIYKSTLHSYLKDNFGEYGIQEKYREKILALADNRFIYLETYKRIYDYDKINFVNLINTKENRREESLILIYLTALASDAGGKYVNELFRILVILSYIKESITINELSNLCYGEVCNYRSFDMLGKLFDLRGFLQIKHSGYGNHIILSNKIWRKEILNLKYGSKVQYKDKSKNFSQIKTTIIGNFHKKTINILNFYPVIKGKIITIDKSQLISSEYFNSNSTEEFIIEPYDYKSILDNNFNLNLLLLNNLDIGKVTGEVNTDIGRVAMCILQNIEDKYFDMNERGVISCDMERLLIRALSTVEHLTLLSNDENIISFVYSNIYQKIKIILFELLNDINTLDFSKEIRKLKRKNAEPFDLINFTIENMVKNNKINLAINFINKNMKLNYKTKDEKLLYTSLKLKKAELLIKTGKINKGLETFIEIEKIYRNNFQYLFIDDIERYSAVCINLGSIFSYKNNLDTSIKWYIKAIDVFEKILLKDEEKRRGTLIFKDKDKYFKQYAYLCGDFGEVLFDNSEVDASIEWISKAINIFNGILSKNNENKVLLDEEKKEMIERFNTLKELFYENEIYIRRSNIYKEVNSKNILNARMIVYGRKKNSNIKTDLGDKVSENKYSNSLIKKIKDFFSKIKNNIFKRISK